MKTVRVALMVVVLLGVSMLPVRVVEAAEASPVSTPDSPMALSSDWVEIVPGEAHIYKFHYSASEDKSGSGGRSPMEIKFYAAPADSARLTLRNSDQIRKWGNEGKNEWFGMALPQNLTFQHNCNALNKAGTGTGYDKECSDANGDRIWFTSEYAVWSATLGATGDYWVVVQPMGASSGVRAYKIVASGPGFQFAGGNP